MLADINIDDFSRDTALILLQLYKNFPRQIEIYVEDIIGPDEPDEYGLHSMRFHSCLATLVWLGDENLIRYFNIIRQEAVDQAVLSASGYLALTRIYPSHDNLSTNSDNSSNKNPEGSGELRTYAQQIKHSLEHHSSQALRQIIQQLIANAKNFDDGSSHRDAQAH